MEPAETNNILSLPGKGERFRSFGADKRAVPGYSRHQDELARRDEPGADIALVLFELRIESLVLRNVSRKCGHQFVICFVG